MQPLAFPRRSLPKFARIKQYLPTNHVEDPREVTRRKLADPRWIGQIRPASRIAITAGSRGFGGFVPVLSGIVDAVRTAGGKPFIIPAMGSHGGATPEGQREILRRLGVTEQSVPAPIEATMETVSLGIAESGAVVHLDALASEADGIIVLGRVKTHPEGTTGIASGLLKMSTTGLGKQIGAQEAHSHGLWESVASVPKVLLAKSKVMFGVAVVENALRQPLEIEVVPGSYDAFLEADRRLLELSKDHKVNIPFDHLDLLVVDRVGKNISGTGMDLNVIGNWRVTGGERSPNYHRIVALSLTPESLGNGLGIGLADFTTKRFMDEFDPWATYVNLLTATEPGSMNTREGSPPLALSSDREAMEVALCSSLAGPAPRICRIHSTAQLDEFWVSEGLLDEIRANSKLTVMEPPAPMDFNAAGNLW